MIYFDIIASLEKALGTSLDTDRRHHVMHQLAADLGGERHYFASLPKLRGQQRIHQLGTATATMTQREISLATGLQVRQIRRLKNGV
jgi:hypothetical protein